MFMLAHKHFALLACGVLHRDSSIYSLAWRYNLGILKGAQGPPAFKLDCLVRNSVHRGGISGGKKGRRPIIVIGPIESLLAISVVCISRKRYYVRSHLAVKSSQFCHSLPSFACTYRGWRTDGMSVPSQVQSAHPLLLSEHMQLRKSAAAR